MAYFELELKVRCLSICVLLVSAVSFADDPMKYPPCKRPFAGMEEHFYLLQTLDNPTGIRMVFVSKDAHPKLDESLTTFFGQCASEDSTRKEIVAYDGFFRGSPHDYYSDTVYYSKTDDRSLSSYKVFYASCLNGTSSYPQPPDEVGHIISKRENWLVEPQRWVDADYLISKNDNALAYVSHDENHFENLTVRALNGAITAFIQRNMTVLNHCDPEDPNTPECNEGIWEVQNNGAIDSAMLTMIITDKASKNLVCRAQPTSMVPAFMIAMAAVAGAAIVGVVGYFAIEKLCKRCRYTSVPDASASEVEI